MSDYNKGWLSGFSSAIVGIVIGLTLPSCGYVADASKPHVRYHDAEPKAATPLKTEGGSDECCAWTPAVLGSDRNRTERLIHDIRNHALIGCNAPEMAEWQRHQR